MRIPEIKLLPDTKWILFVFLCYRFILSGIGIIVLAGHEPSSPWVGESVYEAGRSTIVDHGDWSRLLVNGWYRWDVGYFIKVAAFGYAPEDGSTAFAPLFPLFIRLLAKIIGDNYLLAATVISNIFGILALYLFYSAANLELKNDLAARKSLLIFISFPTAFYLFIPYSESVYIAFLLAAWLFAAKGRWFWTGIMGSLAVLTRAQGLTLVILFAILFISQNRPDEVNKTKYWSFLKNATKNLFTYKQLSVNSGWFAIFCPLLALALFTLWARTQGLDMFASAYDKNWENPLIPPWTAIALLINRIKFGNLILSDYLNLFVFGLFLLLSLDGLRKLPIALSVYSLITLLLSAWISLGRLSIQPENAQILVSLSRYVLALFPFFLVFQIRLINRWLIASVVVVFSLWQFILVWLFVNWYWVA